uniref:hypothetical protein n=1 Tax=Yoonia sp. TaxID=2212373 RepID=UPI0040476B31
MKLQIYFFGFLWALGAANAASAQIKEQWDYTAQVPACEWEAQTEVTCSGLFRTQTFADLIEDYDVDFEAFLEWNGLPQSTTPADSTKPAHFYMVRDEPRFVQEGNTRTYWEGSVFVAWSMTCFEKPPEGGCNGTFADRVLSDFPGASSQTLERLDELNELMEITSWDQIVPANTFVATD